ncbi:recombinase family protein [Pseudoflavitalea sp. X16]|uniref:recombinase family protein n=1 Tax=Paraflavitalea devenefica TaxID=2716334 RepID=UPI00141FA1EF|nr:recombinase family protein [Paraflavitalea devenefica]NII25470.1 recombinase family protein [Paraflavitalea devenefica]
MKKAVLYFRVSRESQIYGMEAQKRFVENFLKVSGMTAIKSYYEKESGKKVRRPELRKAIRYCKRIGATLIFSTMSRLSRYALLVADMMIKKIPFIAADKPYATELENLKEAIRVQEEREDISRRTKDGLREASAKGVELGKYGKIQAAKNIALANAFAQEKGPIIQALHDEGYSYEKIAKKWNKERIGSFHEGCKWHASTVYETWKRSTTIKP